MLESRQKSFHKLDSVKFKKMDQKSILRLEQVNEKNYFLIDLLNNLYILKIPIENIF